MNRIWITSDWHFNHEAIHDFEGRLPGYEDEIIRRINRQIDKNDILINLGDVIFSNKSELKSYVDRIRCDNIVLVRGNHDCGSYNFYIENGFSFVCDEFKLKWQKHNIIFSHKPLSDVPRDSINIHGHLHSGIHRKSEQEELGGRHILYNPEKSGYRYIPVLLKNIIKQGTEQVAK